MAPINGRPPNRGSERGDGGLGSLGEGGANTQMQGGDGDGGLRLLVARQAEGGGGKLWIREKLLHFPLQGGWGVRSTMSAMDCNKPSIGNEVVVAGAFSSGGSYPIWWRTNQMRR